MKLLRASIKDFRCYEATEIEFAEGTTLLVAPNGTGKTALLDAIAACLATAAEEFRVPADWITREDPRIVGWLEPRSPPERARKVEVSLDAKWGSESFRWSVVRFRGDENARAEPKGYALDRVDERLQLGHHPLVLPVIAYYSAARFPRPLDLEQSRDGSELSEEVGVSPSRREGWRSALDAGGDWRSIRRVWRDAMLSAAQSPTRLGSVLASSAAYAVRTACDAEADPYYSHDEHDVAVKLPGEEWRTVRILSEGWRAFLAMVSDLALRMARLNSHLGNPCLETSGVVLIDELELHCHPAMQKRVLSRLRSTFPRVQFVVSTHSAMVVNQMDARSDRVWRIDTEPGGTPTLTPLSAPPPGSSAEDVFTGAWFELTSTLDAGTLNLLNDYYARIRDPSIPSGDKPMSELVAVLRSRLGRFAETSLEEFAASIAAEVAPDFRDLSRSDLMSLRDRVVRELRTRVSEDA